MNRRRAIALLGTMVGTAQVATGAIQERYWVVPKDAIALLELRPTSQAGVVFPGEDGEKYLMDDVVRGLLTYLFRPKQRK